MLVYLATPEIFHRDWPTFSAAAVHLSAKLGLELVLPVPGDAPLHGHGVTQPGSLTLAATIFHACLDKVDSVDAVVADFNPFRGAEPDSGVVVEATYAYAQGIPVVGFTTGIPAPRETARARLTDTGAWVDGRHYVVEDFGLPCNLMPYHVCADFTFDGVGDALARVARRR